MWITKNGKRINIEKKGLISGTPDEIEGIKSGVSKYMKNKKPSRLENELFDRFTSGDTNSAILLDQIQRTKEDVKAIPDDDGGGILDEFGESSNIPYATPQIDPDTGKDIFYGDPSTAGYVESKVRDKLYKKINQEPDKTSNILERIQQGKPLKEKLSKENRLGLDKSRLIGKN